MRKVFMLLMALAMVLSGLSQPAMASLIDRGSFAYDDGAGHTGFVNLIYDDDFDITWVGDGNFAQTTGFDTNGLMPWVTSVIWVNGLTIGGFTDWRLPIALNQDGSGPDGGYNVASSEMGHLFYGELGGTATNPITGSGDPDLGLFPSLQNGFYWSGTEFGTPPHNAWGFEFSNGLQGYSLKTNYALAQAVRSGDVVIPEPGTLFLLGTGLLSLSGYIRKKMGRV